MFVISDRKLNPNPNPEWKWGTTILLNIATFGCGCRKMQTIQRWCWKCWGFFSLRHFSGLNTYLGVQLKQTTVMGLKKEFKPAAWNQNNSLGPSVVPVSPLSVLWFASWFYTQRSGYQIHLHSPGTADMSSTDILTNKIWSRVNSCIPVFCTISERGWHAVTLVRQQSMHRPNLHYLTVTCSS